MIAALEKWTNGLSLIEIKLSYTYRTILLR